jgi:hypothetical protein
VIVGGVDGAIFAQQDAEEHRTWVYPGDPAAGVTYTVRTGHALQVHPAAQRSGGL